MPSHGSVAQLVLPLPGDPATMIKATKVVVVVVAAQLHGAAAIVTVTATVVTTIMAATTTVDKDTMAAAHLPPERHRGTNPRRDSRRIPAILATLDMVQLLAWVLLLALGTLPA
jgi:hypothetical protein